MKQAWIILAAGSCMACSLTIDLRRVHTPKGPNTLIMSGTDSRTRTLMLDDLPTHVFPLIPPDPDNEPLVEGDPAFINLCRPGCLMPGVKVL
jgi:hypothetical protein